MVERQLRRRGISDERVLAAMDRVPRELFVPESLTRARLRRRRASRSGIGQTISQPFIVATICSLLALAGTERVLDVGTGSGYQAAVLAELAAEVVTIERIPELAAEARARLERGRLRERRGARRRRLARASRSGRRSTRSPSPPRPRRVPAALYDQLARGRAARRPARHALGAGARPRRSHPRQGRSSAPRSRAASSRSSATKGLARTDRMGDGDDAPPDYPAVTVESSQAPSTPASRPPACARGCASARTGSSSSKFCVVGATGYAVNLAVYTLLLDVRRAPLHLRRRLLVPRRGDEQLHCGTDSGRSARSAAASPTRACASSIVSTLALLANLAVLHLLVTLGLGEVVAQAIAIVLVTPVNFVGNKLWSFGPRR